MNEREMFDGFDPAKYEEEARQRWGQTKQFAESVQRTRRYTQDDWAAIMAEGAQINHGVASLMDRSPADPRFTAFYEKIRPGLAQFMRDAIHAYCDKLEGK